MTAAASLADPVGPSVRIKRRRWYLAALLSFFCPGLGQLYNTQGRRALVVLSLFLPALAALLALSYFVALSFAVYIAMAAVTVVAFLVYVAQIVDAGAQAWRMPAPVLKRYNRVWVYLLAIVAVILADDAKVLAGSKNWKIPSGSMLPTLRIGDVLVADKRHFDRHEPRRGDLAIHFESSDPDTDYIRRVIGLPGDTVQIVVGRLHINGQAVDRTRQPDEVVQRGAMTVRIPIYVESLPDGPEHLIREVRGDDGTLDNTPVYEVPADHYFMLGDNRDDAMDSRVPEVGFVPRANFRAKPVFIWWSRDRSRIGQRLE